MSALAQRQRPSVTPSVGDVLRSPGKPLDTPTRERFESRFRHDFSRVRVHDDAHAVRSAESFDARAWTFGNDIAFGHGMYAPATAHGIALLDHELQHVVEQRPGIQLSPLSTFLDVVLFVPRLLGLEVFPDEDLKEYLEGLEKRKGEPQKSLFSDNMARACVSEENRLGPYSTNQKVGLVQDMLHGWTTFLDEDAIITLLRRSKDRTDIVTRVKRPWLWSNFSGQNRRIIEAVTMTMADAGETLVTRLRDMDPDHVQDYVANATDRDVADSAKRALALQRITAPVPSSAAVTQAGQAFFKINGVMVHALPNVIDPSTGKLVLTRAEFVASMPKEITITPANANVPVGEGAIPTLGSRITISTTYASEAQKSHVPGYGLGTRPGDVKNIRTHERGHGQAWFDFVRKNPPPQFTGTATMLPAAFNAAVQKYRADVDKYAKDAKEYSHKVTDCVAGGIKPTDEMLAGTGFTAAICKETH